MSTTIHFFLILAVLYVIAPLPVLGLDSIPARQLVVVVSESWSDTQAKMFRFEKGNGEWERVKGHFDSVVGERGLAWGNADEGIPESYPVKREGDRKAPAGTFPLVNAMGYAGFPPQGTNLPYGQILETTHCVDDPASELYNKIVDEHDYTSPVKLLWQSSERMKRKDNLYKWLIVVGYNTADTKPGNGSCIFIHIRRASSKGTAGCTALTEKEMIELLRWLRPEAKPMLVQLTRKVYLERWREWNLPAPGMLTEGN